MKLTLLFLLINFSLFAQVKHNKTQLGGTLPDSISIFLTDSVTIILTERQIAFMKEADDMLVKLSEAYEKQKQDIINQRENKIFDIVDSKGYVLKDVKWESFVYHNGKIKFLTSK